MQRLQQGHVGHVVLGDRCFVVARAADLTAASSCHERCRFELGEETLIVLEVPARPESLDELLPASVSRLTGREMEIAVLVAQGCSTKIVAYELKISEWTVATYLRRIYAKLNVDNRAAMVYLCAPLITASLAPRIRARATQGAAARS